MGLLWNLLEPSSLENIVTNYGDDFLVNLILEAVKNVRVDYILYNVYSAHRCVGKNTQLEEQIAVHGLPSTRTYIQHQAKM